MKGNIADWKKMNVAYLKLQHDHVGLQIAKLEKQQLDLHVTITTLEKIRLATKPTPIARGPYKTKAKTTEAQRAKWRAAKRKQVTRGTK